jgi:hypothetical protein
VCALKPQRDNLKTYVVATLVFLLIACHTPVVFGAFGVQAGDWARYSIEITLPEGDDTNEFAELADIEWIEGRVDNVSGDVVSGRFILHYKNGTEVDESFSDVIGESELPFFIKPNLQTGDLVPLLIVDEEMMINGTEAREYAGAGRDVNYVRLSMDEMGISSSIESYWDQVTGVLCELGMSISGEILGESLSMSLTFLLTDTNVWTAPSGLLGIEWPVWIVAIATILVGTVGIFILKRR